ncbi:hypothetical protein [Mycobacterium sp. 29Ha]|uniref:hypothetical protein n=1 Tax=Mycobacterium sp. 29Ha TaxID=2939268 RepID=UPI002938F7C8|nr:hypothetical protein [Mycobacterium sp. 29Ha]MDV3135336.1 hypothetical protein [Mycobacterium sp. 29Ha]
MTRRLPLAVIAMCLLALLFASPAAADDNQAVITESGKVRCYPNAADEGHGGGPLVVCQRRGGEPFPQSPYSAENGSPLNLAVVRGNGDFYWDIGNIPWSREAIANDIVLRYGQTYNVNGWTILSTFEGTRFTNDRTGHGMFVSVDNVYSF